MNIEDAWVGDYLMGLFLHKTSTHSHLSYKFLGKSFITYCSTVAHIQSTPLNRVTLVPGCFDPIKRRTQLTENSLQMVISKGMSQSISPRPSNEQLAQFYATRLLGQLSCGFSSNFT